MCKELAFALCGSLKKLLETCCETRVSFSFNTHHSQSHSHWAKGHEIFCILGGKCLHCMFRDRTYMPCTSSTSTGWFGASSGSCKVTTAWPVQAQPCLSNKSKDCWVLFLEEEACVVYNMITCRRFQSREMMVKYRAPWATSHSAGEPHWVFVPVPLCLTCKFNRSQTSLCCGFPQCTCSRDRKPT